MFGQYSEHASGIFRTCSQFVFKARTCILFYFALPWMVDSFPQTSTNLDYQNVRAQAMRRAPCPCLCDLAKSASTELPLLCLSHMPLLLLQGPDKLQIAWVNALTYDMIFTQPVVTEFAELAVPVSLIIGTRDRTGPGRKWQKPGSDYELGRYDRLGKAASSLIPDATLYELDGLGHLPQVEDFERFKDALKQALAISEPE